jgi:hypothetical protein
MSTRRFALYALASLAGLSACNGTPPVVNPPANTSGVVLACTPASLGLYATATCSATVKDAGGNLVSPQPDVTLRSSDENVVTVNNLSNTIQGLALGNATITAYAGSYGQSQPLKIEVTTAGSFNCGTFTVAKDATGADFNGESTVAVYSPTAFGTLSSRSLLCRGDVSVGGKRVLRTVAITLGAGAFVAGQTYSAQVELFEEVVNISTRSWRNTPATGDVRLEGVNGNQYRFTYSGIALKPYYATSKGNVTISGDFTATMR